MSKLSLLVILTFFTVFSKASTPLFLSQRKTIDLQEWAFSKGDRYRAEYHDASIEWKQVSVPHTYSMDAITEVGYYQGIAWYTTSIAGSSFSKDERIFIRFEGVGQDATLYLNGKKCGNHSGSYSAFVFELTEQWQFNQENRISLKVNNTTHWKTIPVSNFLFNTYGGIYRPVAIFSTPQTCISPTHYASSGVFIDSKVGNNNTAKVKVKVHISSTEDDSESTLHLVIKDMNGAHVCTVDTSVVTEKGSHIEEIPMTLHDITLWDGLKKPYLYQVDVTLTQKDKTDRVENTFGIRSFDVTPNAGFSLNGQPYKINGVCRHQEWQQYGNALKNEHHKKDIDMIMEMGATGIRLAHYQQAEYMYQLADENGLIIWAEIPRVHTWSGGEHANAKQQLTELILQNYNHPSICFWGLFNEVRGFKNTDAPCVKLTHELNSLAHQLDPSRLTTSATDRNMGDAMNNISDTQGWNKYFGWYGNGSYADVGPFFDDIHEKNPHIKISVSEYGAGANIEHQDITKSEKPVGNYFPEQEQALCHEESWKALKSRDYLWGTFVWNMFDFGVNQWFRGGVDHMNHKGLVTFDRRTKKDAFFFYKANWNNEPMLYLTEKRHLDRTTSKISIKAYCNMDASITLYVNDKKQATAKADDICVVKWDNILLKRGKNEIRIATKYKHKNFTDSAEWFYHSNDNE